MSSLICGESMGCWMKDAYHTAIVVDDFEFTFTPLGIVFQRLNVADDTGRECVLMDVGKSTMTGRVQ